MVDENSREILERILELTDTSCQAGLELLERYTGGDLDGAAELMSGLKAVAQTIRTAQEPLLPQLEHAYTSEMLENIEDTIEDIERSIQGDKQERAAMKMEFQLFPFLRQLRESFYFWGMICPDKQAMDRYYREEFAEHYQNFYVQEEPEFQLSIVVTAYNHLETTKRCINQLLKETDFEALNAELILIDHGSSDGTLEYFESLGIGKVICFKKNVRMYMFTTVAQICKGRYFAFVSNDILVTRNCMQILSECLSSDEKIIAAVPATPNIANLQMLHVPTDDPDEFIAWANEHNRSDPSLWEDRARLMPPLGMYRTDAVSQIGFADPYFYSMEYWDDDFSFRARRAGYRQIVCGNVACYHFGSVTSGAAKVQESTLEYGRELFLKKCGVDPWGTGFCYDYNMVQFVLKILPPQGNISLLALDCGMGDTPLQIRNEFRRRQQTCRTCQLTSQAQYLADLKPHSDRASFSPELATGVRENVAGRPFDCAILGRDIGAYEDYPQLLEAVSQALGSGRCLVFSCDNPFFALNVHAILHFTLPGQSGRIAVADPQRVREEAGKYFSQVRLIAVEQTVGGLNEFAAAYWGQEESLADIMQHLKVEKYYFLCQK